MGAHFSIAFRHYPLITVKQTGIKHYYLEYSHRIWMPGHRVDRVSLWAKFVTPLIDSGSGIVIVFSYNATFPVEI
jgi:hypothetical protein